MKFRKMFQDQKYIKRLNLILFNPLSQLEEPFNIYILWNLKNIVSFNSFNGFFETNIIKQSISNWIPKSIRVLS